MSLEAVSAMLGHRSMRMTLVYARIADRTVADGILRRRRQSRPALHHPLDNITGIRAELGHRRSPISGHYALRYRAVDRPRSTLRRAHIPGIRRYLAPAQTPCRGKAVAAHVPARPA